MNFRAKCAATVAFNDGESAMVLLRFYTKKPGHLAGEISEELGELRQEKTYRITIEEEGD